VLHDEQNNKKQVCASLEDFYHQKGVIMSNAALKEQNNDAVYVASFENLRMTDVESVGGKNASLGEMISQLAGRRRARARWFRHHGAGFPRLPVHSEAGGKSLADRIADRLA
jgi:pyruvate,water dikinase